MKFRPLIDVWTIPPAQRASIQPGQWVQAGPQGPIGQYMGQKRGGTDVVAWRNGKGFAAKRAAYREYAKSI